MGAFTWWHWALVLVLVLVLFGGKGKVSDLMGDVAKGIKSFKKGLSEEADDGKSLEAKAESAVNTVKDKAKS
jgi:sec-independent protein translocase protein TatA